MFWLTRRSDLYVVQEERGQGQGACILQQVTWQVSKQVSEQVSGFDFFPQHQQDFPAIQKSSTWFSDDFVFTTL